MNESDEYDGRRLDKIGHGVFKLFCATHRGYCLGTYDENLKFMKMNTFITHEMLKGSQFELAAELNSEIEKYVLNASNLL